MASSPASFCYGTELSMNLKDAHVNRIGEARAVSSFSVVDPASRLQADWTFGRPARLWYFPREATLSTDGQKGERVYQGVSLMPVWDIRLPAKRRWSVRWTLSLGEAHAGPV